MKEFNTTAVCIPSKHYMVDVSDKVEAIKKLVDEGKYFTINRARQYGKTTTIDLLCRRLTQNDENIVLSLDFQDISDAVFETEGAFVQGLARIICDAKDFMQVKIPESIYCEFKELSKKPTADGKLDEIIRVFLRWCNDSDKPIVLIIDEVDSATNNQVFLDFLAQLRSLYLKQEKNTDLKAFKSVILAGVTDVKHLKGKIREDDQHKVNSPWNIAADFNVDMSLSEIGIKGMLDEYESDHNTGMDTAFMAKEIRDYTNGYPFLVSRLCQLLDQEISKRDGGIQNAWTSCGLDEAIKLLLSENNTLFQSLTAKLSNYPQLKMALKSILMEGTKLSYNNDQEAIAQMQMYGFIRNDHNTVRIDNRIFETRLYNLFLSDEELKDNVFFREGDLSKNIFVEDGILNIRLIMEHFIETFGQVYGPLEERFKEKDGRELFLLYLKPIINGTGNYYIEAQTRDQKRTDVIVDYLGKQYIIELKIWRGERYNSDGEKQITDYLNYFGLDVGYMLSFNFNKRKDIGVKRIQVGDKVLFEGTV